jgi:hypothetical protein
MTPSTGPQRSEDEPAQGDPSAKIASAPAVSLASDTACKAITAPLCFELMMLPSFCAANGLGKTGHWFSRSWSLTKPYPMSLLTQSRRDELTDLLGGAPR